MSLFKVWFIKGSDLTRVWFIKGSVLTRVWFIKGSVLTRVWFRPVSLYLYKYLLIYIYNVNDYVPCINIY